MAENELLRAHVTSVGFALTLGKTHVAALVLLSESLRQKRYIREPGHSYFVPGIDGCIRRGLVVHHWKPKAPTGTGLKPFYTITRAGRLVIGLLQEAGIYQEYADQLPRLEAVS